MLHERFTRLRMRSAADDIITASVCELEAGSQIERKESTSVLRSSHDVLPNLADRY